MTQKYPLRQLLVVLQLAVAMTLASIWPRTSAAQTQAQPQPRPPLRLAQQPATGGAPAKATNTPAAARPPAGEPGVRPAGPAANGPQPTGPGNEAWKSGGPPRPVAPIAPFQLTPEQEAEVNDVLKKWEEKSDKIRNFKCSFDRWEYDIDWGDATYKQRYLLTESKGLIKYKAPDHGKFQITSMNTLKPQGENLPHKFEKNTGTELEHWVCDGESIYQYVPKEKQLIQHKLPPDMRGKAIADGPLPFIFGAKAEQIKRRYFVRITTPPEYKGQQIWIEAWPRFISDAGNFDRVTISLKSPSFEPFALQVIKPGARAKHDEDCNRTVYVFEEKTIVINSKFNLPDTDFILMTPPFWTKVVKDPADEDEAPPETADPKTQAKRPGPVPPLRR